jgi:hypothetical protein
MSQKINRRNLSGIYIFHKFDDEERREPTCFEDCPEEKQDEWMDSLEPSAVKQLAKHLAGIVRKIGDKFDIVTSSEE